MEYEGYEIRPDVLSEEDIMEKAPKLRSHPKLVRWAMKTLAIDKVNWIHGHNCHTPGPQFCTGLLNDLDVKLVIDNEEVLDQFKTGAFVTVSNHPFGALDGIALLDIVGTARPDFKVMVNMFLNHISAMRPGFIAVDPSASNDPEKRRTTMHGIKEAMMRVKQGHPIGFFPAGAVSKLKPNLRINDREWQPSIIRLISQLKVPVIPIFFHGHNSTFFNILGVISWQIRTLRLPAEVFRRKGKEIHVSIGEPISVERQQACGSLEELSALLRGETYALRSLK